LTDRATEWPLELVGWPHQAALRKALANAGVPRVLLVDSDATPPDSVGIDEGWVWASASDRQIDECARRVLEQLRDHLAIVRIDTQTWSVSDRRLRLTPLRARLFAELVEHRGDTVPYDRLIEIGWPGPSITRGALQIAVKRLREQLVGTGLCIRSTRGIGFLLV
jgi:Transcriptional regulatory protein, C terminal